MNGISIIPSSDQSVLVTLGSGISMDVHARVRRFCALIDEARHEAIGNIHPAYASVLVAFDPRAARIEEIGRFLEGLLGKVESAPLPDSRLVEIPVCYGGELGPDLEDVARQNQLAPDDVIRIHSAASYFVYFLGFAPGFAYMGGLPVTIATPRLPTPRLKVPPGSVGIGGNQTGVYPIPSPGGWRLIGRTPLRMFRPEADSPALLRMGDRVNFIAIPREEYEQSCR